MRYGVWNISHKTGNDWCNAYLITNIDGELNTEDINQAYRLRERLNDNFDLEYTVKERSNQ